MMAGWLLGSVFGVKPAADLKSVVDELVEDGYGVRMNEQIKQIMLEAGYAAPELAGRAQNLVKLLSRAIAEHLITHQNVDWHTDFTNGWHAAALEVERWIETDGNK